MVPSYSVRESGRPQGTRRRQSSEAEAGAEAEVEGEAEAGAVAKVSDLAVPEIWIGTA